MIKRVLAAILFVLTLVLAYRLLAYFSGGSLLPVLGLIAAIPPRHWLGLGVLTICFYLLDWVRFRSVLAVLGQRLAAPYGLQLTCVSYFVTCLTPSAELHTPAMVYMLRRRGIPVPAALAASMTKSIYMTLWICVTSYACLALDRTIALPPALRASLPFLTLPLLGLAALLAGLAFFPKPLAARCRRMVRNARPGGLKDKLLSGLAHTAESVSAIVRSGDPQHWVCHLASLAFILMYVAIGWYLAALFGFTMSFGHALTVFSTSLMVAYLAPVPGAIGVTEIMTSYMLDPRFTPQGMAISLALRLLCWYLVTLPGGLILAAHALKAGPGALSGAGARHD